MSSGLQQIIGDYPTYLNDILGRVAAEGFDFADFSQIDHMCYRTTSVDNYQAKKTELASVAVLLGETMVNERPICTFRLNEPVTHGQWRIDAIELPAPKAGKHMKKVWSILSLYSLTISQPSLKSTKTNLLKCEPLTGGSTLRLGYSLLIFR